jgi:hypothetical protein
MQDALDNLKQSKFFSIIDLRSAFLQLPLLPADKEKTAFTIRSGLYQFNTLPFGLKNSPAVFQGLLHPVLGDFLYQSCMVYLDDIFVFSTDFESHMQDLRQIFGRLREYRLKIHPEKRTLATNSIIYLGHLCTSEGVLPDPAKLEAVQTIPPPTSVTEVRSFLGLIGYYRRFIHGFSAVAEPLHALLHKDYAWVGLQEAFETLRGHLLTAPILIRPDYDQDFILQTDWSGIAIGAILAQQHDDGKEHVVAYWSRSLNSAELNYSASEGEAMAALKAIQHFRQYLHGRRFQLQTDHVALKWLMTTTNLQGKLATWALTLQEYDFDVLYKKGNANANADALSRLPNANNLRHSVSTPTGPPETAPLEDTAEAEMYCASAVVGDPHLSQTSHLLDLAEAEFNALLGDEELSSTTPSSDGASTNSSFYDWMPMINMAHLENNRNFRLGMLQTLLTPFVTVATGVEYHTAHFAFAAPWNYDSQYPQEICTTNSLLLQYRPAHHYPGTSIIAGSRAVPRHFDSSHVRAPTLQWLHLRRYHRHHNPTMWWGAREDIRGPCYCDQWHNAEVYSSGWGEAPDSNVSLIEELCHPDVDTRTFPLPEDGEGSLPPAMPDENDQDHNIICYFELIDDDEEEIFADSPAAYTLEMESSNEDTPPCRQDSAPKGGENYRRSRIWALRSSGGTHFSHKSYT